MVSAYISRTQPKSTGKVYSLVCSICPCYFLLRFYPRQHAYDIAYIPGSPGFQHETLKNWEWPEDEGIYYLVLLYW